MCLCRSEIHGLRQSGDHLLNNPIIFLCAFTSNIFHELVRSILSSDYLRRCKIHQRIAGRTLCTKMCVNGCEIHDYLDRSLEILSLLSVFSNFQCRFSMKLLPRCTRFIILLKTRGSSVKRGSCLFTECNRPQNGVSFLSPSLSMLLKAP